MLTIDALVDRCEKDRPRHMGAAPDDEESLRRVEEQLGHRLPAPYRLFLARLGGGVYYLRHEIFGARRVMIHDIELLPDLLSISRRFENLPGTVVPVHQAGAVVHLLDLETGAVRPLASGPAYDDFSAFLASVVIPAEA